MLERVKNWLFTAAVTAVSLIAVAPLFHIVWAVASRGYRVIAEVGLIKFLTSLPPAPASGRLGGIGPAVAGTALLTALSTLISVPVSLAVSILAVEFPENPLSRMVRVLSKAFMEVPTILLSMLIYALVVIPMHTPSAIAGSLALSLVMIPYMTAYLEAGLEAVPETYREAGYSIGMGRAGVTLNVVLGIARKSVLLGIVMGMARALGETAPLLFTAGGSHYSYPMGPGMPVDSLTLLIFDFALTPYSNLNSVAWGAALVLLTSYLMIFLAVKLLVKEVRM